MKCINDILEINMVNLFRFLVNNPFKATFGATLFSGATYGTHKGIQMANNYCFQTNNATTIETLSDAICYGLIIKGNIITYTGFAGISYMCLPVIFPFVFNKFINVECMSCSSKDQVEHIIVNCN